MAKGNSMNRGLKFHVEARLGDSLEELQKRYFGK